MKKNAILFTFGLIGGLASLTGCNTSANSKIDTQDNNILALEAASALNMKNETLKQVKMAKGNTPSFNIEDLVNKTDEILNTSFTIESFDSDKEGYILKQIATINDISYTMYFDKISTKEHKNKDKEMEKYSGIVVFENEEYKFSAFKKVEIEDDEYEEQMHFKMFINETSTIQVKHEYEKENDELEEVFSYSYTENGSEVKRYKIKKEIEDNEKEIKIEENNVEYKLSYYSKNNINYLEVKYNDEKYLYEVITHTDNNYTYYSYELVG